MKFLVDAQLPRALCLGLAKHGHEGVHVADVLSGQTPDEDIAAFAKAEDRIIITKDGDFPLRLSAHGIAIIWLRVGNATNRSLANWLEARWESIEDALASGETLIEVI